VSASSSPAEQPAPVTRSPIWRRAPGTTRPVRGSARRRTLSHGETAITKRRSPADRVPQAVTWHGQQPGRQGGHHMSRRSESSVCCHTYSHGRPTPESADVSEFRLCILMQPSAFPFVISNVVRYTWLGTGTHPSGWARSPNRAPRCGDCSPSFCALLPGVQGQAVPGFGDNSRTRYGRVVRTAGPPGSGALSVDISSPSSPRPAVRCGVPGRSLGRCWHPPGG
jgi:hypothetical protein